MIRKVFVFLALCLSQAHAQETEAALLEEQIRDRSVTAEEAGDPADEGLTWERGLSLRRKLPINSIEPASLGELMGLTSLQVEAFETYRRRLGPFVDPLELQAVPGWDESTVRRVLPWVHVDEAIDLPVLLRTRSLAGTHTLLLRTGLSTTDVAASASADGAGKPHEGSPANMLFRYGYRYGNLMQWGLTLEKDAGERFPGKKLMSLADFTSGHFALRDWRGLRVFVIGDYQVNLGQGLTHWQGMAFRKTSDAMMTLRQGHALRPYAGTDENRFHRGLALEWGRGGWSFAAFLSGRRLDANRVDDSVGSGGAYVSSLLTSGLHRTDGESADRDALGMRALGGRVAVSTRWGRLGLNGIAGRFGLPIRKDPQPYNLHALSGHTWSNLSVDYGVSFRNAHAFGELAVDGRGGLALVMGVLASLHPRLDLAWVSRGIEPRYRALHANAFTEQAEPTNEVGHYAGICLRLPGGWKADAWMDVFRFPWLRYRVDRPSSGLGALVNLAWTPDRKTEVILRWQREVREMNESEGMEALPVLAQVPRSGIRCQVSYHAGPEWMVRARVEGVRAVSSGVVEEGFLCHFDLQCRPARVPWRLMGRLALYETGGYASRIYGFENDVPYRSAMSAFYGKGVRAYLVGGWRVRRNGSVSGKLGCILGGEGALQRRLDVRLQGVLTL